MKILLISGHGNGDSGALGNRYKEADLTRELVNLIAPKLRAYATVDVYNQSRNAFKDCQNGTFNIGKYDYVFEVHFNAFNGQGHGTECYVTSRENGITVEQEIMKRMGKYFTLRDNDSVFDGVKRTNFLVINTVKNKGMSGALLETCFIDNANDMRIYQANKDRIAADIVDGMAVGFGLKASKPNAPTEPSKPSKPTTSTLYRVRKTWSDAKSQIGAFKDLDNAKKLCDKNKGYKVYSPNGTQVYPTSTQKSIDEIAREVINGKWGNGQDRANRLKNAGYNPTQVQNKVNEILAASNKKSIDTIAREVIRGEWGNGQDRVNRLRAAGYDPVAVQNKVNQLM